MTPYDKINALTDISGDLTDIREKIHRLGNLNADIDTPLYQALYQIEQALHWQNTLAQDEPKNDVELWYERMAKEYGAERVNHICYDTMLKEMQGGTAV